MPSSARSANGCRASPSLISITGRNRRRDHDSGAHRRHPRAQRGRSRAVESESGTARGRATIRAVQTASGRGRSAICRTSTGCAADRESQPVPPWPPARSAKPAKEALNKSNGRR